MGLRRIEVSDFRCLESAALEFDPQFTLITGGNASGKTSLLEAVYLLGRGRSFRTRRLEKLIRSEASRFVLFGEVDLPGRHAALGVEGSSLGLRARLGGEYVGSVAELAAVLPVQVIDPEVHQLIEDGPARRRRYLDWGVFHVEQGFVRSWQGYQVVLKQRNAALRSQQPVSVVAPWDAELIRLGGIIHDARSRYVARLAHVAAHVAVTLLDQELQISYRAGWPREVTLQQALAASWAVDRETGVTHVGPQRADLAIRLNGRPVKDRVSRGQQKLLAAALLIAQLQLLSADSEVRPTLLLDDPAAELDDRRLLRLINGVAAQSAQLIVTSLTPDFQAFGSPGRRYRVSEGRVEAL